MIEALYIHIPFCVSRCTYCDFSTSACDDDARMDAYVEALSLQLRRASRAGLLGSIKTIYIGGGTPTHLGSKRLNSLVYLISLSVNLENVVEFTCEANPESLDERMVADLYALGVDRFSLGAQSFVDDELAAYGRAHDVSDVWQALKAIRARTENISIDLICGGPHQTIESWRETLQRAVDAGAPHVSVYPLALEEGTPLAMQAAVGDVELADDDAQAEMLLLARDVLVEAGYERYEVASYAKPGFASKHNASYWTGKEYLGLGSGASSMLSIKSFEAACEARIFDCSNAPHRIADELHVETSPYRVRVDSDPSDTGYVEASGIPRIDVEFLTEHEAKVEDLMLGMRLASGVSREQVLAVPSAQETFERLMSQDLVGIEDGRFAVTDRGWLLGNVVFGAIWDLSRHPNAMK